MNFKDIERFHPDIPRLGRFFLDAWNGTRPAAIRIIASVHTRAVGRFKTAVGLSYPFPIDRGAGLGCLIAAVSSIHFTTVVYKFMEKVAEGFDLLGPEGFAAHIIAFWYADDELSLSKLLRAAQGQVDAALLIFLILQLKPGHDKDGSKTAIKRKAYTINDLPAKNKMSTRATSAV